MAKFSTRTPQARGIRTTADSFFPEISAESEKIETKDNKKEIEAEVEKNINMPNLPVEEQPTTQKEKKPANRKNSKEKTKAKSSEKKTTKKSSETGKKVGRPSTRPNGFVKKTIDIDGDIFGEIDKRLTREMNFNRFANLCFREYLKKHPM